jgi:hypothetical protein
MSLRHIGVSRLRHAGVRRRAARFEMHPRAYTRRMSSALNRDLESIRDTSATAKPGSRLVAIRQRLARTEGDAGAMRLVTLVSAVEALARSLVAHAPQRPSSTAPMRYQQIRTTGPVDLVVEMLRLYGAGAAAEVFGDETWRLFELAHQSRNMVVHECTTLPQDSYPPLIAAAERVLDGLVQAGGLLRAV